LIAHFAETLQLRGQSPRTLVAYQRDLESFGSFLAGGSPDAPDAHVEPPYDRLATATRADIVAYVTRLSRSRSYADRSIRRKVSALRTFYKMLRFEGRRDDNPATDVPTPKVGRPLPGVLAVAEVTKTLAMAPLAGLSDLQRARDRAIIELLYSSGLRRSELIGLDERDVDLESRSVRVLGKGNKVRVVPMTAEAAEALRRYRALRPSSPSGAFFLGRGTARISESGVYKIVRTYLTIAGVDPAHAHPHILRHSVATHMRERGADVLFLKEFLGHASTATTEIYTHVSAELLRREFDETHARPAMDGQPPSRKRLP
jgi:site-specific recombinase XerD